MSKTLTTSATAITLLFGTYACGGEESSAVTTLSMLPPSHPNRTDWKPVSTDEPYEGKSLEEWAIEWRRWAYAQTDCEEDTLYDRDGSLCTLHQSKDAPVFFFDRGPLGTERTKCRVPKGKAIGIPIGMFSNDNAGVEKPMSEKELRDSVVEVQKTVRDLVLEVDGIDMSDLSGFQVGPIELSYYIPPAPNWYSCRMLEGVADTTVEPAYLGGFLAILPPPAAGSHTIRYAYTLTYDDAQIVSDITSIFEVE